jgi:hypothetical protein
MALIENVRAQAAHDPVFGSSGDDDIDASTQPTNPLDSDRARRLHGRLWSWYEQEREKQSANRLEMALDEDYYDGLQWREDDADALEERGQAPLVFNFAAQKIDWMIGTERRTRVDHKILARKGGQEAIDDADRKTKLMKYVSDVSNAGLARSFAFSEAVKVGIGWLEEGARSDITDEPLYSGWESWRNMLWDSCGRSLDGSDWRYVVRLKSIDLDMAVAPFRPGRAAAVVKRIANDALANGDEDEVLRSRPAVLHHARYQPADGRRLNRHDRHLQRAQPPPAGAPASKCGSGSRRVARSFAAMFSTATPTTRTTACTCAPYRNGAVGLLRAPWSWQRAVAILVKGGIIEERASRTACNRLPSVPVWCCSSAGRTALP